MPPKNLRSNYPGRRFEESSSGYDTTESSEESESNSEESESGSEERRLRVRCDVTTRPHVETLEVDAGLTTSDQPLLPRPDATCPREYSALLLPFPTPYAISAYSYSPLENGYIRLLRLIPHRDDHAPIQCELFDYPFLDSKKGTHLYEALSYVWGSTDKPRRVFTDKGYLHVKQNLHAALTRLRDHSLQRTIWIDAVCINQYDTKEKSQQVQSMARIYAGASRVNVWLEDAVGDGHLDSRAAADSQLAFEEIGAAANGRSSKASDSENNRQAVLKLLQRSWFQRIWVLQEVAAARHILIMCHSTEMDGYAFCSGLDKLKLIPEDPDMQSRIRSAVYLIKTAGLRPKCAISRSAAFSLHICPLGELVDMYHNRKATDCRDKVYALLGMSTDLPVGLSAEYNISWKDVFRQLIESLIDKQVSVETWDGEEVALIKSKGCALGTVSSVRSDGAWVDTQSVDVVLQNVSGSLTEWSGCWTIQASAKSILKGDIVCLLEGASQFTIIRPYEDYCAVIAISVTPTADERSGVKSGTFLDYLRHITVFPLELLLVWDWEMTWGETKSGEDFDRFLSSRKLKDVRSVTANPSDTASRLADTGLLFRDLKMYEEAIKKLGRAMKVYQKVSGKDHPQTLAVMDSLAWAYHGYGGQENGAKAEKLRMMADLLGRRGRYVTITEDGMIQVARSFDQQVMSILLDRQGHAAITEDVIKATAENWGSGEAVMRLLLKRRPDQIIITENVVKAAAENGGSGVSIMRLLLDKRRDQVTITEDVIKAAAGNSRIGAEIMKLLLERRGNEVIITEDIVKAAAVNNGSGDAIMKLFFKQRGDQVTVTEDVVKAVAGNSMRGVIIMNMLHEWRGYQITINEDIMKAAAENYGSGGKIMKLFLQWWGDQVTITEDVLMGAVGNRKSGEAIIKLLVKKRKGRIPITDKVIEAATRLDRFEVESLLRKEKEAPGTEIIMMRSRKLLEDVYSEFTG